MKGGIFLTLLFALLVQTGCGFDERRKQLDEREKSIAVREQTLMLKEKELRILEDSLKRNFEKIDSISLAAVQQSIPLPESFIGRWNVSMVCTQTSCSGFAVGDVRKETWQIASNDVNVTVRAMQGEKLIRVYTGVFTGTHFKLSTPLSFEDNQPATSMKVDLRIENPNKLTGQRLIVQPDGCTTTFKVDADKPANQ